MAINTENRRRSILPVLPRPNNEIDPQDRRSVQLIYSGFVDPDAELFPGAVTVSQQGVGAVTTTPLGPGAVTAGPKTS